jgi:hypothetical protein
VLEFLHVSLSSCWSSPTLPFGDDFIDFISDELVALDELEIPRQRKSMDTVKNWYGNKILDLGEKTHNIVLFYHNFKFRVMQSFFLTNNNLDLCFYLMGE